LGDGQHTPCCQTADAEVVETDSEQFNCETCEVARRIEGLDTENRRAWGLFHQVCSRFAMETRSSGTVLAQLTREEDEDDMRQLTTRLAILYDGYYPRKKSHGA